MHELISSKPSSKFGMKYFRSRVVLDYLMANSENRYSPKVVSILWQN